MRAPLQSLQNTPNPTIRTATPTTPSPKKHRPMAEVMQPFVQSSSSMSMLQSRSTPEGYQSPNSSQQYQQTQRHSQAPRSSFTTPQNAAPGPYRATATAPVQPYAFQSTPNLQQTRTNSAPVTHTRSSSTSDKPTGSRRSGSKEDLANMVRPHSVISLSSSIPDLSLGSFENVPKASPERYRRNSSKKADASAALSMPHTAAAPSGSGMSSVEHLYIPPPAPPAMHRTSSDDLQNAKSSEAAKRYRRRSTANMDNNAAPAPSYAQVVQRPSSSHAASPDAKSTVRPVSSHHRKPSSDKSSTGSIEAEPVKPAPPSPARGIRKDTSPSRASARGTSDKRLTNPSPLSKPAFSTETPEQKKAPGSPPKSPSKPSPAAQQLAALSDKDLNKGMKSRLRRAFSFGSAAELRKASATRQAENAPPATATGGENNNPSELDAEQMEIARRQEAAGIGAGIYSGQGGFAGSTDNISISSTASSASVMLRKMGTSMKKGGRSLKGLFRPKSVIGVPAADGPIQPSLAEVSMVTVEAERQRVNVNAHVADQADGGTGFPKLDKNSLEIPAPAMEARGSAERNDSLRKSIVGSDKERAEVLAAVKKGILKRNGTSSPQGSPVIRAQSTPFTDAPHTASPAGSLPGTPKDERKSRSLSSTNSSNPDYFSQRLNLSTRSMPATPQSSRNISFSPRIQFHDVWSSTEYDRRGDVATCNRLTPMLAQQIKEELNTFKMEMEVHELSKPHTHFF
ncbi:hypothetical protein B9Z65_123 [Elsinoe australis]|uniref:Protein BNI4 n=1 Tax=Elsinoe australis TaxID=40998 RepID=A0A2P7ZK78_9PEZI|nr:hypothetical protein B9Z65_123 [Elsinoe australis]